MIVGRVATAAVPGPRPLGRLADAARPLWRVEGRRVAGAAPRGGGAAANQPPAAAGLGRPGGPGRADPAVARAGAQPPVGHAGHRAALASPSGREELDLPEPRRPATAVRRGRGADRTARPGQPVLGLATSGSRASCSNWAIEWARRLFAGSSSGPVSRRRRVAAMT